ncbi:alpha/beta hydrolase [Pseudonocardia sp. TRM90224]|uniref:alpha/beta hydrolase n=1 Tax=Pseudonocardia sp. TRM90224 TaxID=2812678 RepID=UPI001E3C6859|nr:alpha/beta hydrolase-fold protein [Pseudonocardia sp. TRM90224]
MSPVRRRALLAGLGLLAAGCASTLPPAPAPQPPARATRVHSAARGTEVNLVITRPTGAPDGLPVCVALHGRGSNAGFLEGIGLQAALDDAVRAGVAPFAVAAVDGDHYWVDVGTGDDPQRMLADELPGWLVERGLGPVAAAFGISMGGFGALRYARDHPELRAVAVCSAALFLSWGDAAARKVFADRAQWESHEPLRHTQEVRVPTGVWCGNGDPFLQAARDYAQAASPEVVRLTEGGHTNEYWQGVLPEVLAFVGQRITR